MTKQELNRDIKRLSSEIYLMTFESQDKYFEYLEQTAKPEFIRLLYASDNFSFLTKDSILRLLSMNRKYRFYPFHNFGNKIELI